MRLFIAQAPIGKARHRFNSKSGVVYDPQKPTKMADKWIFAAQMREKGFKTLSKQPLSMSLTNFIPMPRSWSTAKKRRFLGQPAICKPDVDNAVKYYCDVLNRIAYEDDAHISQLWSEKLYSDSAGVEINLTPIGGKMIQEHAITVKRDISGADLGYMVKKAHRIGLSGRQLVRVYAQEDEEGKHYYFECECLKENISKSKKMSHEVQIQEELSDRMERCLKALYTEIKDHRCPQEVIQYFIDILEGEPKK